MTLLRTLQCVILLLLTSFALSAPSPLARPRQAAPFANSSTDSASSFWIANIKRQGTVAYGSGSNYTIFRNVMDYGAAGDGVTDDTAAINLAISTGNRCGQGCDSSTTTPAIVYFPAGTYMVSSPLVQLYYTQMIGDPTNMAVIKATSSFQGIAVIDADPYIPGGNGANFYTNQNNFYRQIRNFVIDLTDMPISAGAGIHWQVAQATSLQNIVFNMLTGGGSANKQQGIFMDNGSGGFMSDLVFNGGAFGAFFGNQQFTTRNMTFNNCQTAIYMNWNWLWTLKSVTINNCQVGIDMSELDNGINQTVGSIILMDSTISNTPIGVKTSYNSTSLAPTAGTLVVQNVDFTSCQMAVAAGDGSQILAGGSVIASWAQGNTYQPQSGARKAKRVPQIPTGTTYGDYSTAASTVTVVPIPAANSTSVNNSTTTGFAATPTINTDTCTATPLLVASSRVQQQLTAPTLPAALMSGNAVFERSKPQYEDVPSTSFVSVKDNGAIGDGVTDDTAAIQAVFDNATQDQIVYFDHGAYVITDTVNVPSNIRMTGEIWPLIMANGASFNDVNNPKPVFRVGNPGDVGNVEMSDMVFETLGPAPGAIMMEWNLQGESQGSAAMWDVHFRIGGTAGTQLLQDTCPANVTGSFTFKPECAGSFIMLHITQQAAVYVENMWLWVADHDLDSAGHDQVDIFNGRGMMIESAGPTWLYGTSSEHSQLYNYQVNNAQNIFMGAIQTETPYMQSSPNALDGGFPPNSGWSDPDFSACTDDFCRKAWGLRVQHSEEIYMYGAGLYSFFDNYQQTCLDTESCQTNMVDIECSTAVYLYGLSTKAATNMVVVDGAPAAEQADNTNGFCQTIALFEEQTTPA